MPRKGLSYPTATAATSSKTSDQDDPVVLDSSSSSHQSSVVNSPTSSQRIALQTPVRSSQAASFTGSNTGFPSAIHSDASRSSIDPRVGRWATSMSSGDSSISRQSMVSFTSNRRVPGPFSNQKPSRYNPDVIDQKNVEHMIASFLANNVLRKGLVSAKLRAVSNFAPLTSVLILTYSR
jgi:hypothetical protein